MIPEAISPAREQLETALLPNLLDLKSKPETKLTHQLFKFPAKFHPKAVTTLLEKYTLEEQTILDPFCGSGTLLVEALASGRHSLGSDVDPLSVFLSKVKSRRINPETLASYVEELQSKLSLLERPVTDYEHLKFNDITLREFESIVEQENLQIPAIPNLHHWFRLYVIIDLARIVKIYNTHSDDGDAKNVARLALASIIRSASNADPVPVSGLEVTSHMRRKDEAGRVINPLKLYKKALNNCLQGFQDLWSASNGYVKVEVQQADATNLNWTSSHQIDAVITSPPYHNAVDYYRRHQLEMYWLGLVDTHSQRLNLIKDYIGRPKVAYKHPFVMDDNSLPDACSEWLSIISATSRARGASFKHYLVAMQKVGHSLSKTLKSNGLAILVVGESGWNGLRLPTGALIQELWSEDFDLEDHLYYPVKNRYMSYARRNSASIDEERVLVFRKKN